MALTRRSFLGLSAGGLAMLSLGAVGLSLRPHDPISTATPPQTLTERQYSTLTHVADRLCPGGEGLPSARDLQLTDHLDQALAEFHPGLTKELTMLLDLLENPVVGLLLHGRSTPFSTSSAEEQLDTLMAWKTHKLKTLRLGFKALCNLTNFHYWSKRQTHAITGYPGPPDFRGTLTGGMP